MERRGSGQPEAEGLSGVRRAEYGEPARGPRSSRTEQEERLHARDSDRSGVRQTAAGARAPHSVAGQGL